MTTEQTEPTAAAPADDFQAMIDEAAQAAQAAKATRPRAKRVTYTGKVRDTLAADPDISKPDLIRKVLGAMGVQSSGLDAMSDDELMQVVAVGHRTLDIRKNILRAGDSQ